MSDDRANERPPKYRVGDSDNAHAHISKGWWAGRVVVTFLAWAWSVVAIGVAINAYVKFQRQKRAVEGEVPPPTVLSINSNDILSTGIVILVVSILLFILLSFTLVDLFVSSRSLSANSSLRFLPPILLLFFSVFLLPTLIAHTFIYRVRSAHVTAFLGGVQLPDAIIETVEEALGVSSVYRRIGYLKLTAILPWFTLLFSVVAAVVLTITPTANPRMNPEPISEQILHGDRDTNTTTGQAGTNLVANIDPNANTGIAPVTSAETKFGRDAPQAEDSFKEKEQA